MDAKQQKDLVRFLLEQWKDCHRELTAYKFLAYQVGEEGFPVELVLQRVRTSEEVRKRTDQLFRDFDEIVGKSDEAIELQTLADLMAKKNPNGYQH